jgi:hypothetical protein
MVAKYGQGISLLSANLIYRKGYKLAAWIGSDGEEYAAPGGDDMTARTYEITTGSTSYPWTDNGGEYISTNNGVHGSNSSMYVRMLISGYFSFEYYSSGESSCDCLQIYKNGSYITYFYSNNTTSPTWSTYQMNVTAGDTIEFRFKKDGSVHHGLDRAGIRNFSGSAKQTVYTFTSDMTFRPKWEAIPFDVRVYYNYPDGGTSFKIYSVYAGDSIVEKLNESPIGDPTGYSLKGYSYSSESGADLLSASDVMPGEDIILYGHWQANTVTITYYDAEWNILYEQSVLYGTEIELYEYSGVDFWKNYGDQLIYSPGGSYLVSNDSRYYLQFVPASI